MRTRPWKRCCGSLIVFAFRQPASILQTIK